MSYTEYLRRKAAAAPVVIDTRMKLDASSFTNRVRLSASVDFARDGQKYGSVANSDLTDRYTHGVTANKKVAGGRVPDASIFTAANAGQALANQALVPKPVRYVLNSNDAGSLTGCLPIPAPIPAKTASQAVRDIIACHERKGEQHFTNATTHPGPSVFVDDTITHVKNYNLPQNTTKYQIAPDCTACGGNPAGVGVTCALCVGAANHAPSADMPHNTRWGPRPTKSAQPILVAPSPSDARKVGAAMRHIPTVGKHHGNAMIGHIQYPDTPYQIPAGTAAHLKINEPMHYPGTM